MNKPIIEIGTCLKELRKARSETLHQVAKTADVDSPLLSKIERGERLPTDDQLKRLAAHYEASVDDLQITLVAQRILRDYGVNQQTYAAVKLVEKQLAFFISEL
ncbi:helix-turn-helix domain-containing protein [Spirosoma gilvum]